MGTPTNQQAEQEKKPTPRQNQPTAKGKTTPTKSTPNTPRQERATPRPNQSAAKTSQPSAKATSQPTPKSGAAPAPKAATPPAPRPRDPSVARRDERREARRLEIQARQQERRLELRQARRQKLLIRYDLIIAPILLIALVAILLVLHQPIGALAGGLLILFAGFTVLAYATLMPTSARRLARPRSPALGEAAVVESTLDEETPPSAAPADEEAASKPGE